jgi:UDP-2,3-diacylglucosamine pyrophosphatase LpxH
MVIVSDLHMGRGNNQDDFRYYGPGQGGRLPPLRDSLFNAFCRDRVREAAGDQLTFVLNGDVIDFWEVADDEELTGPDATAAIRRNLMPPKMSAPKRQSATEFAKQQLTMALDAHQGFCRAIRHVLEQPDARVVYLFGNHDHVMVNEDVQNAFRAYLESGGNPGLASGGRLTFGHFLKDDNLGVYVEHGNQFSSGTSEVADPENWQEQALGYYGLRFIWNRFQAEYGIVKPTTEEALALAKAIIRRKSSDDKQRQVFQYVIDYFSAFDDGLVPRLVGYFDLVYNIWRNNGKPKSSDQFFISHVKEELNARGQVEEPSTGPKSSSEDGTGGGIDRYLRGVTRRFKNAPRPFKVLGRDIYRRLFLGHTHRWRDMDITPSAENRLFDHRYLNTASWTRDLKRPYFGYAYEQNGEIRCKVVPVQ